MYLESKAKIKEDNVEPVVGENVDRADLMIARKVGGIADIETWKTGDESTTRQEKEVLQRTDNL